MLRFPAIDINKSGTRKEELLLEQDVLQKIFVLRKVLAPMSITESMELLLEKLRATKNNELFLGSMNSN